MDVGMGAEKFTLSKFLTVVLMVIGAGWGLYAIWARISTGGG